MAAIKENEVSELSQYLLSIGELSGYLANQHSMLFLRLLQSCFVSCTRQFNKSIKPICSLWCALFLFLSMCGVSAQTTNPYFKTESGVPNIQALETAPTVSGSGALYFNTTTRLVYMFDGSRWIPVTTRRAPDGTLVVDIISASGREWMDRNLGASQAATSPTDYLSYGSLFQWCRFSDGHEKIAWKDGTSGTAVNGTTTDLSPTTSPDHSNFITPTGTPTGSFDWLSTPQTDGSLWWDGTAAGVNNPCPTGYHVPTQAEWEIELACFESKNAEGAYKSMKLPVAGYRHSSLSAGSLFSVGKYGYYWSSTAFMTGYAYFLYFYLSSLSPLSSAIADVGMGERKRGYSIRCIKDASSNLAPVATNLVLSGLNSVGETLNASYSYFDPELNKEKGSKFQWYRSETLDGLGAKPISEATLQSYTLTDEDEGKYIGFEVIPGASFGAVTGDAVRTTFSGPVTNRRPVASDVVFTGSLFVNQSLTGRYVYSDFENNKQGNPNFQWYRSSDSNGSYVQPISGATLQSYTLTDEDEGKYIGFEVIPVSSGGLTGNAVRTAFSGPVTVNSSPVAINPVLSGLNSVGVTLYASYVYSDPDLDEEAKSICRWYRSSDANGSDAKPISGATLQSYTLTDADEGKYIGFEVIPVASFGIVVGSAVRTAFSGPIAPNKSPEVGNVGIDGYPVVNQVLTGTYLFSDFEGDSEGNSTFQWYRSSDSNGSNKEQIANAIARTYRLTLDDLGKCIWFGVTPVASKGSNAGVPVLSSASGPVRGNDAPEARNVVLVGYSAVDHVLTGNYDYWDVDGDKQINSTFQWYRSSDSNGSNEEQIGGATLQSYTLTDADKGKYIRFEVIPRTSSGIVTGNAVRSAFSGPVDAYGYISPVAQNVVIGGYSAVGVELVGRYTFSDFEGDYEGNSTFQWYRSSDSKGSNEEQIANATARTYRLTANDLGKCIWFEVKPVALKGYNAGVPVRSSASGPVRENGAPEARNITVTGYPAVGQVLRGSYDYWDVDGDMQLNSKLQWYRSSDSNGTDVQKINGATLQSYTLTDADKGKYIRFEVIPGAFSGIVTGNAVRTAFSGPVAPYGNISPVAQNVVIEGYPVVNQVLAGKYIYSDFEQEQEEHSVYHWYRSSDSNVSNAELIIEATDRTYSLTTNDLGKYIWFEVKPVASIGTNEGVPVLSSAYGPVLKNGAPEARNVALAGSLITDQVLTGSYDYWDLENELQGTPQVQWYRSSYSNGIDAEQIEGATLQSYTLTDADKGKYIGFEVIPRASSGTVTGNAVRTAFSGPVAANESPYASNIVIEGYSVVKQVLTGKYIYSDFEHDPEESSCYQWYRSDVLDRSKAAPIDKATDRTYSLTTNDLGKYIWFEVKPRASRGSNAGVPALSYASGPVLENGAPEARIITVTGYPAVGQVLTGGYNYWDIDGDKQLNSKLQWYRSSDSNGTDAQPISGATLQSYTLTKADEGKYIRFEVIPGASYGTITGSAVRSAFSGPVAAYDIPHAEIMGVAGHFVVNHDLTGRYVYFDFEKDGEKDSKLQWYRSSDWKLSHAAPIDKATGSVYRLTDSDLGKYIWFGVTPEASKGSKIGEPVFSYAYGPVIANEKPEVRNLGIAGYPSVGQILKGSYDYWDLENEQQGNSKWQWYRFSDLKFSNREQISGATLPSYTLKDADKGKYIGFEVIPETSSGVTGYSVRSPLSGPVVAYGSPVVRNVALAGSLFVGYILTGSYDYWDVEGNQQNNSKLQWYRSETFDGSGAKPINEATLQSYTLTNEDEGKYIGFEVIPITPSKAVGYPVRSAFSGPVAPNQSPFASNIVIEGYSVVNQVLTGKYIYSDFEHDPEESSCYQWYRSAVSDRSKATAIDKATDRTYRLTTDDLGQYIWFEVKPVASRGSKAGEPVSPTYSGPVRENDVPVASEVSQSGVPEVGHTLEGRYTYADLESDDQGSPMYQWYRANDSNGSSAFPISGATQKTYTITRNDLGKYIGCSVTPVALDGSTGLLVYSSCFSGPVIQKGPDGTVVMDRASVSGRVWMDRNLGASRAATSSTDYLGYGSLFQWCRAADGHEKINWTDGTSGTAVSGPTNTISDTPMPGHSNFIVSTSSPYDWLSTPQANGNLWWKETVATAGANNPCPTGFHVPTMAEWEAERTLLETTTTLAYDLLGLTFSGYRENNGTFTGVGSSGFYWSSTPHTDRQKAYYLDISPASTNLNMEGNYRAFGGNIRCIKDN